MQEKHYLVPHHHEGAETDIIHTAILDSVEDAADYFVDAKDRLLEVINWERYSGITSVQFRLADKHKHFVSRRAHRGDHIVINDNGEQHIENYDWLTIDALEYDDYPDENRETFAIRLHLSSNEIDKTSATIVIERSGKKLSAIYHGRNNATDDPEVWHGLEDTQWSALMKGLVEETPAP